MWIYYVDDLGSAFLTVNQEPRNQRIPLTQRILLTQPGWELRTNNNEWILLNFNENTCHFRNLLNNSSVFHQPPVCSFSASVYVASCSLGMLGKLIVHSSAWLPMWQGIWTQHMIQRDTTIRTTSHSLRVSRWGRFTKHGICRVCRVAKDIQTPGFKSICRNSPQESPVEITEAGSHWELVKL